jgi:hypothetical protein
MASNKQRPQVLKMDLSTWLTTQEVATRLRVKPRTVADLVVRGLLHPQKYKRPGKAGAPISLFDPDEVNSLDPQRPADRTKVLPAGSVAPAAPLLPLVPATSVAADFAQMLGVSIVRALATVKPSAEILTPADAALYAKLSVDTLRKLRREGKLPNAGSGHRVLYRRADLDKLSHRNRGRPASRVLPRQ